MNLKKQKNNFKIFMIVSLTFFVVGGLVAFFGANDNKINAMENNTINLEEQKCEEKTEEKSEQQYEINNEDAYKYINEVVSKMLDESNKGGDDENEEIKERDEINTDEEGFENDNEFNEEFNEEYNKEELKTEIVNNVMELIKDGYVNQDELILIIQDVMADKVNDKKMMEEMNKLKQDNSSQLEDYKHSLEDYKHSLEEMITNLESEVASCKDDDTKELLDELRKKVEDNLATVNGKIDVDEKEMANLKIEFDGFKQSFQDGLARLASKINSLLKSGECQTNSIDDIEAAMNDVYDNGFDSGYNEGYEEAYDYGYEAGKKFARTQSIISTKINVNHGQYWEGIDSNGTYDFSGIKNVTWKVSGWCNESEEDGDTYTSFWVMLNDEFVLNSSDTIDLCGSVKDGASYKEISGKWNVNGNSNFNVKLSYNSAISGGGATFEIVSIEYY